MELQNVDRKTRKLMTLYGMLHPRGEVDRLYLPKEIGRRRLMGVEDCVRLEPNERLLEQQLYLRVYWEVVNISVPRKSRTETAKSALRVGRVNPFTVKSYGKQRM